MHAYLNVTRALADAGRLRLLCALRGGELCACHLIDLLQLAPSTVSKHLSILHDAGLVQSRKAGRWVIYRLSPNRPQTIASRLTKETFRALSNADVIRADERRLAAIRKSDCESPCQL